MTENTLAVPGQKAHCEPFDRRFLEINIDELDAIIAEDTQFLEQAEEMENRLKAEKWWRSLRLGKCYELKAQGCKHGEWKPMLETLPHSRQHIDRLRTIYKGYPKITDEDIPKFIEEGITKTYERIRAQIKQEEEIARREKYGEVTPIAYPKDLKPPIDRPKPPVIKTQDKAVRLAKELKSELKRLDEADLDLLNLLTEIYELCESKVSNVVSEQ